jgi:hypothetical protein
MGPFLAERQGAASSSFSFIFFVISPGLFDEPLIQLSTCRSVSVCFATGACTEISSGAVGAMCSSIGDPER